MRTLRIFFYTLAALCLGDVITTEVSLHSGGVEANPVMRSVVTNPVLFAGTKIVWLVGGYLLMRNVYRRCVREGYSLHWVFAPLSACVAMYGWVVLNNLDVIRSVHG